MTTRIIVEREDRAYAVAVMAYDMDYQEIRDALVNIGVEIDAMITQPAP